LSLETRLKSFKPTWLESNFQKKFPKKPSRVFVGSMSEIYYWKIDWLLKVINRAKEYPQHIFMFLTKHPQLYHKYDFPKNCWLGTTVTEFDDRWRVEQLEVNPDNVRFVSLEPLLDNIISDYNFLHNWIIVGLETGRKNVFIPEHETIKTLVGDCKRLNIPLFMKNSMKKIWPNLIQEFPG